MPMFEIHISVEFTHPENEVEWIWFCKDNSFNRIRHINFKGAYQVQNMCGKYHEAENIEEAIKYAKYLAEDIKKSGFKVIRTKVEGMMNSSIFDNKMLTNQKGNYWEFHIKVIANCSNDVRKLIRLFDEPYIGLSMSGKSVQSYPIVTIRLSEGDKKSAIAIKEKVIEKLEKNRFTVHSKFEAECSVYDDNQDLDKGWLD